MGSAAGQKRGCTGNLIILRHPIWRATRGIAVDTGTWGDLYRSVQRPQACPVMTGFNANIDRIIPVTPGVLLALRQQTGPGFQPLLGRLEHSMRYCLADEMVIGDPAVFHAISGFFSATGSLTPGGQAGIAAIQMRRLNFTPVTCAVPGAGPRTRTMLRDAGVLPLTFAPETVDNPDNIHLVFEYSPGLVPVAEGVVPRVNRFIVSPAHEPSTILIPEEREAAFLEQIASCRRAFLSGYQYLRTEEEFIAAAGQLARIRSVHPRMRTHVECVSGIQPQILRMMLDHILQHTDSIGLNEQELDIFHRALGAPEQKPPVVTGSSPVALVRDAIAFAHATGVPRLHLHTFGYYILVKKPGTGQPELSRNALLFAAQEAAGAAGGSDTTLSPEGLMAYAAVRAASGPEETPGIFRIGDRIVVIIPTLVARYNRKTTGLGDILSSTAFVADPF
ncbi:MAG: ADP-dependent glucokinase/phosphofructokinase [Methanoregula sp.]